MFNETITKSKAFLQKRVEMNYGTAITAMLVLALIF